MSHSNPEIMERQNKQKYLKENILDAGYDATNFSNFICAINPDGENIDIWTMEELKKIVNDFIAKENKNAANSLGSSSLFKKEDLEKKTSEISSKNKNQTMEESKSLKESKRGNHDELQHSGVVNKVNPFEQKPEKKENIVIQTENMPKTVIEPPVQKALKIEKAASPTDPIQGVIQINKMDPTALSNEENIVIRVADPEAVTGGIIPKSYVSYTVKTAPFGWVVKRRYNDFFWLRETLHKLHPGVFIPPIPKKKWKSRFNEGNIRKRMYFFDIFLNNCLKHKDLKSDKYLYHFLSLNETEKFFNVQEQANLLPRVERLEKLATATGEAKLDMSSECLQYANYAESYCSRTDPIYKRIRKLTKLLMNNMKQSANIVLEMSKWFNELEQVSHNFNSKMVVESIQSNKNEDLYLSTTKMMEDWSSQLKDQANNIYKNFVCFYKYSSLENEVYKEMNKERARFEAECRHQARELEQKKERLFVTKDMSRWEINEDEARSIPRSQLLEDRVLAYRVMLDDETKQVRYQNNMLAYLNANTCSEMIRGLSSRTSLYRKSFQDFIVKQTEHMSKLQGKWTEIMGQSSRKQDTLLDKSIKNEVKKDTQTSFGEKSTKIK